MNNAKKIFKTVLISTLIAVSSVSAIASASFEEGKIIVGMDITYPPFESYDGDKVVGFDPELTALLANKMGVKYEFVDSKFTGLILGLSTNKFDAVISGMYITPDRLAKMDAIPYASTGASILVIKGSEVKPEKIEDLCGLKVGMQQGLSWIEELNKTSESYCTANGLGAITIQEFPTAPEVTQAIMSRNVQVQIEIAGAAKLFVERTKGRVEITSKTLLFPEMLGIYINKDDKKLKEQLLKAMADIKNDGLYKQLITKYELIPIID